MAQSILPKAKIYLDVRFWIILRDAAESKSQTLLELIRKGVATGKVICPISQSTFVETLKQANTPNRRTATACLIDELSLGVGLVPAEFRAGTEITRLIYANEKSFPLHSLEELVWTKAIYSMGYRHPVVEGLQPSELFSIQKRFVDEMWRQTFSNLVSSLGEIEYSAMPNFSEAARTVAAGIRDHTKSLTTFENLYRDELAGVVDVHGAAAVGAIEALATREGIPPFADGSEARAKSDRLWRNALFAALTSRKMDRALRTLVCEASLHAGLRWNRRTKFEANHFYDFDHAVAAICYCDAFFTEGFLSNLVNGGNLKLNRLNGCQTTDSIETAIEITQIILDKSK